MSETIDKYCPVRRWQRRKDARPAEIISAALDLFVDRGFAATRLDEVAKHAGVSKGTIYLYFNSKEALFRSVVQELVLPELDRFEVLISEHRGSAEDLLRILVRRWWENIGESRLSGIPKMVVAEAGNFPELARFFVEEVVYRGRGLFVRVLEMGVANQEFRPCNLNYAVRALSAPLVFAAIWKHSLLKYDKEPYDVQDYLDTHVDIFLRGLR